MGAKTKGRPRKQGTRTKSGQLSRAGIPSFDRGSTRTADKYSVYGQDGSDAIGRAYVAGLLGEDGLNLRNAARSIFRAYWPMLAVGRYQCAIGDKSGGAANDDMDDERLAKREGWLTDTLRRIDRMGRDTRRAFDQLVIDINPDEGPVWLDAMLAKQGTLADRMKLDKAMDALKEIAG